MEIQRRNALLVEEVEECKLQLAHLGKERLAVGENFRRQTEEFAQRLSSLEKRYQQVISIFCFPYIIFVFT